MYSFKNDYSEGCHPRILAAMTACNLEQNDGYGLDTHSENAKRLIKAKIKDESVDVHLMVGGTQTNLTAIAAFLRPYQAAISVHTGHIYVHETGSVEATGHKVIVVHSDDGKLTPEMIQSVVDEHTDEHMVQPKLVYISNPTEIGTIYSKSEMEALQACCKKNGLIFYMDGARLGSALRSKANDLDISDLPKLTDAFYIGATKNGGIMGEALVICNPALKEDFRYMIKQRGGMFAKGHIIGMQFEELFRDDLYFELADHANAMAQIIKDGLAEVGCPLLIDSPTNQIFPIFPNEVLAQLEKNYIFTPNGKPDADHSCVRIVTSWASVEEEVRKFVSDLKACFSK